MCLKLRSSYSIDLRDHWITYIYNSIISDIYVYIAKKNDANGIVFRQTRPFWSYKESVYLRCNDDKDPLIVKFQ